MRMLRFSSHHAWMRSLALVLCAAPFAGAVFSPSAARADQIVVNISQVKTLDKTDALSKADFLARVTIAGEVFTTATIRNQDDIQPNWSIRKTVEPGVHDVKLEILDKDVTKNDFVDINQRDNKRDLDFKVDTRRCAVIGFSVPYRCGSVIARSGNERKKAEVTFVVDVKR
jgi:C2 domain